MDNPVAGLPLPCATAPPHVRTVAAGETKTFAVAWSGLYAPEGCADAGCARFLPAGRYLLAANAVDAERDVAYVATTWLTVS